MTVYKKDPPSPPTSIYFKDFTLEHYLGAIIQQAEKIRKNYAFDVVHLEMDIIKDYARQAWDSLPDPQKVTISSVKNGGDTNFRYIHNCLENAVKMLKEELDIK